MNQCCQKTWWVKINIYIYKNILKSILQKICPPSKKPSYTLFLISVIGYI